MKTRILVAVVGVPFLLLVLIWLPDWATLLLVTALCGIGAHELMHAVTGERGKRLMALPVLAALLVPVCLYVDFLWTGETLSLLYPLSALFLFLLFLSAILRYGTPGAVPFADITAILFAGLVFPLMLSCLLRLRLAEYGVILVFVPLAVSFGSDTFAYFTGLALGKHKLSPRVSPKKTVEGSIGGLIGGVLGLLLVKILALLVAGVTFLTGWQVVVLGLVGAAISQVGDLSFSVIKREFGVKDYGKLLPGHGGVLDRFDSVTFVAPFVWILLQLI